MARSGPRMILHNIVVLTSRTRPARPTPLAFRMVIKLDLTVELKNNLAVRGTLYSMDHYLNFKLKQKHGKVSIRVARVWRRVTDGVSTSSSNGTSISTFSPTASLPTPSVTTLTSSPSTSMLMNYFRKNILIFLILATITEAVLNWRSEVL